MAYIDGLPEATTFTLSDFIMVCQGSTGNPVTPGSGTDRRTTINRFVNFISGNYLPITGGTLTGELTIAPSGGAGVVGINAPYALGHFGFVSADANGGGTITWGPGTREVAGTVLYLGSANMNGVADAGTTPTMYNFSIPSDQVDSSHTGNGTFGFVLNHNFGGGPSSSAGGHTAMLINITQTGTWNANSAFSGGLNVWGNFTAPANLANVVMMNPQLFIGPGATGFYLGTLMEGAVNSSTPLEGRVGISMVSDGAFQGSLYDYAYGALANSGTKQWMVGYQVGRWNGPFGIDPQGSVMGVRPQRNGLGVVVPQVAKYGIELASITFTEAAISTNGFSVLDDGTVRIGTGSISPTSTGISITATGYVGSYTSIFFPGSSYKPNDELYDTLGLGIVFIIDTVNGAGNITSGHLKPNHTGYSPTPGPSPVLLMGGSSSTQMASINMTWTQRSQISIGGAVTQPITAGTNTITYPVNSMIHVDATLKAISTAGDAIAWKISFGAFQGALPGSSAIIGAPAWVILEQTLGASAKITANTPTTPSGAVSFSTTVVSGSWTISGHAVVT